MKSSFAAGLVATAVSAIDVDEFDFMKYLSKFGKMYKTVEEFDMRKGLFILTDLKIKAHNSRPANYTLGHN